jgi:hypothetical protein
MCVADTSPIVVMNCPGGTSGRRAARISCTSWIE